MTSLWVHAVIFYVSDGDRARAFWAEKMGLPARKHAILLPDGVALLFCEGRSRCTVRGPHGLVPALEVEDIARAKAWLRRAGAPIVFEEVVPGLARFTLLDPDGNAVDLVQVLEVDTWERGARIPEQPAEGPPRVRGLFEISLYALDTSGTVNFYRERLGLPTGLAYFAHVHLLFENMPLVIRPTWHRCQGRHPHTPALVVGNEAARGGEWSSPRWCGDATPAWEDGEYTRVYLR